MNLVKKTLATVLLLAPLLAQAFISNEELEVEKIQRISEASERVKQFRQLADRGNTYAIVNLAAEYQSGRGVAKDPAEANRLYQKAASLGNPKAMMALGDYQTARTILLKESESGNGNSSLGIAFMYMFGKGVPKDNNETIRWLRKASDQGSMNAMYLLGQQLRDTNREEAIRLLRKAASLGHGNANAMANDLEASSR